MSPERKQKKAPPPSQLQQDLVARILRLVREDSLGPGARLVESQLARRLKVSRTPIRSALDRLAEEGVVERQPNRGIALIELPAEDDQARPQGARPQVLQADDLLARIAEDLGRDRLPKEFSETELMRFYGLGRQSIRDALSRLAELGALERKPGYGWRFLDAASDPAARQESFRFRIILECGAMLEPSFAPAAAWIEDMREQHMRAMAKEWTTASSVAFYEMNAAFHEGIAAAAGNRFVHAAIAQQNQFRRMWNYYWRHGRDRVIVSCREHLEILDRLGQGQFDIAALLMRRHLEGASRLAPPSRKPADL